MFAFMYKPDPYFNAIITASLEKGIDYIKTWLAYDFDKPEEKWVHKYPRGGIEGLFDEEVVSIEREWLQAYFGYDLEKMFSPTDLISFIETLIEANKSEKIYALKEFQILTIYSTLEQFVDIHNDIVNKEMSSQPIKETSIGLIDFDEMTTTYIGNFDFLMSETIFGTEGLEEVIENSDPSSGPISGYKPHPDELTLEEALPEELAEMDGELKNFYAKNMDYPYLDPSGNFES